MIGFILAAALHAERSFCTSDTRMTLGRITSSAQCDKVMRHWVCHEALTRRAPSDDDVEKRLMARIRREHPCPRVSRHSPERPRPRRWAWFMSGAVPEGQTPNA